MKIVSHVRRPARRRRHARALPDLGRGSDQPRRRRRLPPRAARTARRSCPTRCAGAVRSTTCASTIDIPGARRAAVGDGRRRRGPAPLRPRLRPARLLPDGQGRSRAGPAGRAALRAAPDAGADAARDAGRLDHRPAGEPLVRLRVPRAPRAPLRHAGADRRRRRCGRSRRRPSLARARGARAARAEVLRRARPSTSAISRARSWPARSISTRSARAANADVIAQPDGAARPRPLDRRLVPRPLLRPRRRLPGRRPGRAQGVRSLLRPRPAAERGRRSGGARARGARTRTWPCTTCWPACAWRGRPAGGGRVNKKLSIPILGQGDPEPSRRTSTSSAATRSASTGPTVTARSIPSTTCAATVRAARAPTARGAGAAATWPQDIKKLDAALRIGWADGHESLYPLRGAARRSAAAPAAPASTDDDDAPPAPDRRSASCCRSSSARDGVHGRLDRDADGGGEPRRPRDVLVGLLGLPAHLRR